MSNYSHGVEWTSRGQKFRYVYREHKGKTYKRKQKLTRRGWIFVGIVLVAVAAATWAPAGGFSWLFRAKFM